MYHDPVFGASVAAPDTPSAAAGCALLLANPKTRTVAEIATDQGFWELGRFSVAFRKLFGKSPSVTLRRSADSKSLPLASPVG
jgi:Helix-turn-helix domain